MVTGCVGFGAVDEIEEVNELNELGKDRSGRTLQTAQAERIEMDGVLRRTMRKGSTGLSNCQGNFT